MQMKLFGPVLQDRCRCGHAAEAHRHFRSGTDCALCAAGDCRRFRSAAALPVRLLNRLRSRAD